MTRSEQCRPATIELTSAMAPGQGSRSMSRASGTSRRTSGLNRTNGGNSSASTAPTPSCTSTRQSRLRCDPNTCRTCVTAISARIGFTPSEIRLHEELRRNRCARKLTMQHERQHEAVTGKAQAMAVREAKYNLRWARYPHAARVTPASGREAGQEELMRKVGEDLARALETAMAYADSENSRLDRPERYRRESRRQWRICGDRQAAIEPSPTVSQRQRG